MPGRSYTEHMLYIPEDDNFKVPNLYISAAKYSRSKGTTYSCAVGINQLELTLPQ
jgi:hypothetical protein